MNDSQEPQELPSEGTNPGAAGVAGGDTRPSAAAPEPPSRPASVHHRGGGSGVGVALIVIGCVILVARLVPGLAWWSLWPLFIVVGGLAQCFTPGDSGWTVNRFFDGLVTIAIGLVFLAITTGLVEWGVVWRIFSLWPVLLIAVGFDILGKSLRASWIRILSSLAVIGALGYAVALSVAGIPALPVVSSQAEQKVLTEPVRAVTAATLQIDTGMTALTLGRGADLVRVTSSSPWVAPELDRTDSGATADLTLSTRARRGAVIVPSPEESRLDVALASAVAWDLKINAGASSIEGDLSDLAVHSVVLKPGASSVDLKLGSPSADSTGSTLEADAGLSSIALAIPSGTEVRVVSSSGLSATDLAPELRGLGGGVWETDGYAAAQARGSGTWTITLKSGLSSAEISFY